MVVALPFGVLSGGVGYIRGRGPGFFLGKYMCFVPGVISVLSVGKVAGTTSPARFVRLTVSISCGANLRLGFGGGVSAGADDTDEFFDDGDEGEGVAEVSISARLLRTLVSIGCGINLGFFGECEEVLELSVDLVSLLLLDVVSTGSTAYFRLLFTEVSTGVGKTRRVDAWSDIFIHELKLIEVIWGRIVTGEFLLARITVQCVVLSVLPEE